MDETQTETSFIKNSSKKGLLLIFGALILITLLSLLPAKWMGVKKTSLYTPVDIQKLKEDIDIAADKNRNGIPDWKESLSENLGDLNQLNSEFNNENNTSNSSSKNKLSDDPNNLTASFAKNMFTIDTYAKQNGIESPEYKNSLTEQALLDEANKLISKTYYIKNLDTDKKENEASIKEYGNKLGLIIKTSISKNISQGDITLLNDYTNKNDRKSLDLLEQKSKDTEEIIRQLINIKVPYSAAIYHVSVLNRLEIYKDILFYLSQVDTDPVKALLALKAYESAQSNVLLSVSQLSNYFNAQNITFSSKESGYIFTSGYNK